MLLVLFALLLQILLISILIVVFVKLYTCHEVLYLILILSVLLILQIFLIIMYCIYKAILSLPYCIYKFYKFMMFFYYFFFPYFYMSYSHFAYKMFPSVTHTIIICLFIILLIYLHSNLYNKMDPTGFISFVIFICITMLSCCLIFMLVMILLGNLFELVKYLFQSICFLIGQFYETISHNNFSSVKHFLSPLYNLLLSFFDIISKIMSILSSKAYGYSFVCHLLNYLTKFSVLFYKDLVGNMLKSIMLAILEVVGGNIISVYILVYLFYTIIKVSLVFLLTKLVSFLSYISSTNIYIFTFGHIEGYIYSFWIYNLKDSFSYLVLSSESLYFVEAEKVGLFFVMVNIVGIFIILMSIFYSLSIYTLTIGLHMDVCFSFILNSLDGISFVSFFMLFSFSVFYMFSIMFFISCMFAMIILFLSLYYFSLILFNKSHIYFLIVQGNYFHFSDYLMSGANKLDTSYIKSSWDKIDDFFKYEELFVNKTLEIQEDSLDKEEEKKDPNKFYYKSLFVNLVAFLSFTFVFVMMFISYVYF